MLDEKACLEKQLTVDKLSKARGPITGTWKWLGIISSVLLTHFTSWAKQVDLKRSLEHNGDVPDHKAKLFLSNINFITKLLQQHKHQLMWHSMRKHYGKGLVSQ